MIECEYCEGTGEIEVLYCETRGACYGMDYDRAVEMAGDVHHREECPFCEGTGEVDE